MLPSTNCSPLGYRLGQRTYYAKAGGCDYADSISRSFSSLGSVIMPKELRGYFIDDFRIQAIDVAIETVARSLYGQYRLIIHCSLYSLL